MSGPVRGKYMADFVNTESGNWFQVLGSRAKNVNFKHFSKDGSEKIPQLTREGGHRSRAGLFKSRVMVTHY